MEGMVALSSSALGGECYMETVWFVLYSLELSERVFVSVFLSPVSCLAVPQTINIALLRGRLPYWPIIIPHTSTPQRPFVWVLFIKSLDSPALYHTQRYILQYYNIVTLFSPCLVQVHLLKYCTYAKFWGACTSLEYLHWMLNTKFIWHLKLQDSFQMLFFYSDFLKIQSEFSFSAFHMMVSLK